MTSAQLRNQLERMYAAGGAPRARALAFVKRYQTASHKRSVSPPPPPPPPPVRFADRPRPEPGPLGFVKDPFVAGGLDAIGAAFGDPGLGQQVGVVADVVGALANIPAFLDSISASATYTPEEYANNRRLIDAGIRPSRAPPPAGRTTVVF